MGALFSWVNAIDSALIAAGDQVVTLPASFLADPVLQKVWRSGTSTATYFTADLRSSVSLGVLGLFGCNLAASDIIRIRLSNVALGNSELLDTGAVAANIADGYGQYVYVPLAPISARYLRVDVNAPSRAGVGNFDIGRAWAGPVWIPTRSFAAGWGEQWCDDSDPIISPRSGRKFVDVKPRYRAVDLEFNFLSDADKASALALDRAVGKSGQMLFVPETGPAGNLTTGPLLGSLKDTTPAKQNVKSVPAVYAKNYSLRQDL